MYIVSVSALQQDVTREPAMPPQDYTLLSGVQLAKQLNVAYDFVKDMRKAGYEMPIGGLTTLTHAWKWLSENGDFRERARTFRLLERPANRARHRRQAAGKCGESLSRRG